MISKEDAKILLEPLQDRLWKIAQAADIEDPQYDFPSSKTSRANNRHDAMMAKAAELFDDELECIRDVRTGIWASEKFAFRFRKMNSNGAVRGVSTKRAMGLKQSGQLTLFTERDSAPISVPIFYVGYKVDQETDEIEDYLISVYEGGAPVWVMSFDEIIHGTVDTQIPLPMPSIPAQRTKVRVKVAAITAKETKHDSSTQ